MGRFRRGSLRGCRCASDVSSDAFLVQDLLGRLLAHPADQDQRPPEVAPRPGVLLALAAAQSLRQRQVDPIRRAHYLVALP